MAASCPGTRFVIGGYSQGATVIDIAVGIRTGTSSGTAIATSLASRVAAVVVFGNPLGTSGRTIATASSLYRPKSRDYCATGDPVCGGGSNLGAHLTYASVGYTTQGAQFAAALVGATPVPTPTPTPTPPSPTPTPTPPNPTTPAQSPTGSCVRASTSAHVSAGRAVERFNQVYAVGSNDYLGVESNFVFVSLRSTGTSSWERVLRC